MTCVPFSSYATATWSSSIPLRTSRSMMAISVAPLTRAE